MHHELLCGGKKSSVGGLGYLKGKKGKGVCIEYLNMNVDYVMWELVAWVRLYSVLANVCLYVHTANKVDLNLNLNL